MVKESRIMKSSSFEYFVISVLRQIASSRNQDIVFDARIPVDMATSRTRGNQYFDAIAPNGFDGIQGPVIFEISRDVCQRKGDWFRFMSIQRPR